MFEARDPHLKKFVKVGNGNAQKPQTFQQWDGVVLGEFENALMKRKQAKLAVKQAIIVLLRVVYVV